MSLTGSLLTLLVVAVVLLAFAMAGLLRQVRELQAMVMGGFGRSIVTGGAPAVLRPSAGRKAFVLVLDNRCPACGDAYEAFVTTAGGREDADFTVLTHAPDARWQERDGVQVVVDAAAYRELDLPFRPAVVQIDEGGNVVQIEPAGSADSVAAVLGAAPAITATDRR